MKITYCNFAMQSADTFSCPPIGAFVQRYLQESSVSIDPFARNFVGPTYTNDLNPETLAQCHMDSAEFLEMLLGQGVAADLGIIDPPYSPTQMKRTYDSIGLEMNGRSALRTAGWKAERDILAKLIRAGGHVLSFGWNTTGMGSARAFRKVELLVVCHGASHHDTLCLAERKVYEQLEVF